MPNTSSKEINASELIKALSDKIEGEVRFDAPSRALYATDASNYRQVPIGVVIPKSRKDVIETVRICSASNVSILARGAATSLAGQCCNVAVVIDMSKYMNRILEVNPTEKFARVEPGVVLDVLRDRAEEFDLTFGPDPSTHNRCTLGGMIGNDSCGVHSVMSGKTMDNVLELEVLTYDGTILRVGETTQEQLQEISQKQTKESEIYRGLQKIADQYGSSIMKQFPKLPRRVSGYALDQLLKENNFHVARSLVGTEGTCVIILEAKLKLVTSPQERRLVVLGYEDIFKAADDITEILKFKPIGLEAIDRRLVDNMYQKKICLEGIELLPKGNGWLFVEFGTNDAAQSEQMVESFVSSFSNKGHAPAIHACKTKEEQASLWKVRESGPGATVFVPNQPDTYPGWEDSAVHPKKLGGYLRDLYRLYDKYGYFGVLYGHFGDGCVHTRINFDLKRAEGIHQYRSFIKEAAELVVRYGGSLSGEHGDGQARGELLGTMYSEEILDAFRAFKSLWDPKNKLNPGKVIDAYPIDHDLRPAQFSGIENPKTSFRFPEDDLKFSNAINRCVGLGKCRKMEGATMCPSFRVTAEEKHSPRGRAHLLYEMLQGDVIRDGWKDEDVKDALDLCLSCKACKVECPTNVDIATYKAEFLSHYYKGKMRALQAHFFGNIQKWAERGTKIRGFANFLTQSKLTSGFIKQLLQVAPERQIPALARKTFKEWFRNHESPVKGLAPEVILWPDTFNNYFRPQTLIAAVEVLETMGYRVQLPKMSLCCGRPFYDYGMIKAAKKSLLKIMKKLLNPMRRGVPIVGLEPGCLSVFRDEMPNLFPNDVLALRFSKQIFLLSEFLARNSAALPLESIGKKALIQGHCHQQSLFGMSDEEIVLSKLGLDYEVLDSGCCGMAGSFGYEQHKFEISKQIAEQVLLPRVREADKETLIIANGFSCREQVEQLAGRQTHHLSEVVKMAIHGKNQ